MAKENDKDKKRHQVEKYAAPQHISHAGSHSSEQSRHTDACFLLISPHTLGWPDTGYKVQSLRDQ